MSINSYNAYKALVSASAQIVYDTRAALAAASGFPLSQWLWVNNQHAGLVPSTSIALNNTTMGGLHQQDSNATHSQYVVQAQLGNALQGFSMLVDRLVHHGGLDATVTTTQTTNLPTAATTRYTGSYAGNMVALQIYVQIGVTSSLVGGSYTNQDGTTGRQFQQAQIGNTNYREIGRMIFLPLQAGDTGVQSVQNITLSGSTGTAGNFGVTIFRPIWSFAMPTIVNQMFILDAILSNGCQMGQVQNGACLDLINYGAGTFGAYTAKYHLIPVN